MAYTDIDDPSAFFQTTLYTGNGASSRSVTHGGNSDLQSDWTWIKNRTDGHYHNLNDSVRGVNKKLRTGGVAGETANSSSGYLSAFASDGFTVTGGSSNMEEVNTNSDAYVSWNWKAGTSFTNDASGTSIGSIDSAGSFNNDAGFSICSYTGNGTAGATIKHGLNSVPSMMIIKDREGGEDSIVFHQSLGNTKFCYLSTNAAAGTDDGAWNDTSPTTSVFTIGDYGNVNNNNHDYICYVFSEKQGYSKFGSYIGNGQSDGPFIPTGFKPAFVMTKRTDGTGDWAMMDNKRNTFNVMNKYLKAQGNDAESTDESFNIDAVSNGFKLRYTNSNYNGNGGAYIYMAFAENPFTTSTGIPTTAR